MTIFDHNRILDVSYDDMALGYYASICLDHRKNMSCPEKSVRFSVNYSIPASNRHYYKTFVLSPSMSLPETIVTLTSVLNYVSGKGVRKVEIVPVVHPDSFDWNIHHMLIEGIKWYLDEYGSTRYDRILIYGQEDWMDTDIICEEVDAVVPDLD